MTMISAAIPAASGPVQNAFSPGARRLLLGRLRGPRLRGDADLQRIGSYRFGDVFKWGGAEIGDGEIEPALDLAIGVLGRQIAPGAQIPSSRAAILTPSPIGRRRSPRPHRRDECRRGSGCADPPHANVALAHAILNFDRAAHGVDHAAKLNETPITGPLDDTAVMGGDGGIDEIAAQSPKTRERAILVRSS